MKSNKGQALVEFVMILLIFLLLIFTIVDFGRVIISKSELEDTTSDVISFYYGGKTEDEINYLINKENSDDVENKISNRDDYIVINTKKTIKPITPGLTKILKKVLTDRNLCAIIKLPNKERGNKNDKKIQSKN